MSPPVDPDDDSASRQERDSQSARWQFSIRWLFGLTAAVAAACSLAAWCGGAAAVAIVGAAAGAFVGAFLCPLVGFEQVLDDLRSDILRCLAVGTYLGGGTWAILAALQVVFPDVHGQSVPPVMTKAHVGFLIVFLITAGVVVKAVWTDIDAVDAVIVTIGSLIGVFAMWGALSPLLQSM